MIGYWNSYGRFFRFLLHDNVASTLVNLHETVLRENLTYLSTRQDAEFTQLLPLTV